MFWAVNRLSEKLRKHNIFSTTVPTFTYSTGTIDFDKKASVEKVFLTIWSEIYYMFKLGLQEQERN